MKRKSIRLAILSTATVVAVLGAHIAPSWAYFTDSVTANGEKSIAVQPKTDITERIDENQKFIKITNDADSESPVFVRAMVFANEKYFANGTPSGTNWEKGSDGYWYYTGIVEPGAATEELRIAVAMPVATVDADGKETPIEVGENFNIIVVYEATPAQYDDQGNLLDPQQANWDLKANTTEGGE